MKYFLVIFIIMPLLASCATTSVQNNSRAPQNKQDEYKDNGLSKDDLYELLKKQGHMKISQSFEIIGFFASDRDPKEMYDEGIRQKDLDFFSAAAIPGLVSFWTVRKLKRDYCFQLSHVKPEVATFIGPSENWCLLSK